MPEPRIEVGRFSPITHRIASSRFDLPQPLGPTIPVSPASTRSSAGSTKLLKPLSLSRLILNPPPPPAARSAARAERGLQLRLKLFPRPGIGDLAVDEKSRRRVN